MKKTKVNLPLIEVLVGSLLLHIVAGVILGGFVLYQSLQEPEPEFVPPPEIKRVQPEKLEYKVKMKQQQKQSAKPRMKRIQVESPTNISVPQIDIVAPAVSSEVSVGTGMGGGNGSGSGLGGGGSLGMGKVSINMFGLRGKGEKILILVNGYKHMLEDNKGGVAAFEKVKMEILNIAAKIPPGTLFNVGFYGGARGGRVGAMMFEPGKLVAFTPNHVQKLRDWMEPIHKHNFTNFAPNTFISNDVPRDMFGVSWDPPVYRVADGSILAQQLAMELGADSIFYIGPYFGWYGLIQTDLIYERNLDPRIKEWTNHSYTYGQKEHDAFLAAVAKAKAEVAAMNRSGDGPVKVVASWQNYVRDEYGVKGPLMPEASMDQLMVYLKAVEQKFCKAKGIPAPRFYGIHFIGEDEAELNADYVNEQFMQFKQLARKYKGRVKTIEGFKQLMRLGSRSSSVHASNI